MILSGATKEKKKFGGELKGKREKGVFIFFSFPGKKEGEERKKKKKLVEDFLLLSFLVMRKRERKRPKKKGRIEGGRKRVG